MTFLYALNIFPDMIKAMLKGIIMSLGIQSRAVYIHLFIYWVLYPGSVWLFAFKYDFGIVGIWLGRTLIEYILLGFYYIIIE